MSQDPHIHITIHFVEPQEGVGEDLKGCYFVYDSSDDTYSFFQRDSETPLRTGLKRGDHFDFTLEFHKHLKWTLHISKHSTPTMVEGKWKDKEKQDSKNLSEGDWEPEQSYQATAGGGIVTETATDIMEIPEDAIFIDHIDGSLDGLDLRDCYFIWHQDSNTYSFFDRNGKELGSDLTIGSVLPFHLDYFPKREWAITIDPGSDSVFVKGRWGEGATAEPEGSYQAQAGIPPETNENAASATV